MKIMARQKQAFELKLAGPLKKKTLKVIIALLGNISSTPEYEIVI